MRGMRLSRIAPVLLMLIVTTSTIAAFAGVSYWAGSRTEPLLRFLDGSRAPTIDEAIIAYPMEYALHSTEANDVIFLGDSTCHDGIDPRRLSGFTSYNLGSVGGVGPAAIALTAQAYLKHHPKPRAVVLCLSPFRLDNDPGSAGGQLPFRFIATYGPGVPGAVSWLDSTGYFVKRGAAGLLAAKSVTWREMRDLPLLGMKSETYHTLEAKTVKTRGFFDLPGEHGSRWTVEVPKKRLVHEAWTDGVERLALACRESGVTLVIRFGPVWDGVSGSRDFTQLEDWADRMESKRNGLKFSRPLVLAWDRSVMWDALHVNHAGVDKFMPLVAKEVQAALVK